MKRTLYLLFVVFMLGILESCNSEITTGTLNGHEWVDLGLPSGTCWATYNVGAAIPEGYGDNFAWGEIEPKETYNFDNYRFRKSGCGKKVLFSKYVTGSRYGDVDNLTTLEASDDAATVNWGAGWRMPTYDEFKELKSICNYTYTTRNGVKGWLFTGSNGNSIFLPITDTEFYWSSSLFGGYPAPAWSLWVRRAGCTFFESSRYDGLSVRPVCVPTKN